MHFIFENCVNETLEPIKKALTSQVQVNRENFLPCAVKNIGNIRKFCFIYILALKTLGVIFIVRGYICKCGSWKCHR